MEINENLAKLIFREFDDSIKGTDIYNHDGSMWLIFTEERKWVVEFTNQKTLWYNYKHFNDILMLFGMEVSDGAKYIKKWYEDKFIFNAVKQNASTLLYVDDVIDNGVKETGINFTRAFLFLENTIQNGVKHTCRSGMIHTIDVEDTIQNGVKKVDDSNKERLFFVEDTIENGVKNTQSFDGESLKLVNKIIDDGVKHTEWAADLSESIEDTIQNGVNVISWVHPTANHSNQVDDIIQNGVKKAHCGYNETLPTIEDTIQNGVKEISSVDCEYPRATENVIKNGVKEMYSLSEDLEQEVDDTIMMGVKYYKINCIFAIWKKYYIL